MPYLDITDHTLPMIRDAMQCHDGNKIPDSVIREILKVYEFETPERIKRLPNSYICQRNGDFWTTWEKVLEIREEFRKIRLNHDQNDLLAALDAKADAGDHLCGCAAARIREQDTIISWLMVSIGSKAEVKNKTLTITPHRHDAGEEEKGNE